MAEPPDSATVVMRALGIEHPYHKFDVDRLAFLVAGLKSADFMLANFPKVKNNYFNNALLTDILSLATLPGMVLEFGVHTGDTIKMIAKRFEQPVFGFDWFHGLPEDWTYLQRSGRYSSGGRLPANLPDNVQLVVGLFQDTLPTFLEQHPDPVRFVHIDSDLYSSASFVLTHLADRLVAGTLILFNDFMNYPNWENGESKAWFELVAAKQIEFEYVGWASKESGVAVQITRVGGNG